ncbi:stalk domain-containing protein [Paenibacillus psychroresistens]|nr:stalk domain-containing protein [Paenibacillus psychroresistens]
MKKWILAVSLVFLCFLPISSVFAAAVKPIKAAVKPVKAVAKPVKAVPPKVKSIFIFLDGKKVAFKLQQPINVNGRVLVPLRDIFEALGAKIEWDDTTKTVTAKKADVIITYKIGSLTGNRNNEIIEIPVAGKLVEGTTMIPLRFVGEALGTNISWDEHSQTVLVSSKVKTEVEVTNILEGNVVEIKGGDKTDKLVLIGFDQLNPNFEAEATQWLSEQLVGMTIHVEMDSKLREAHGYLLAYVYLPDGSLLNSQIFAKGYAKLKMTAPNTRWTELLTYVQNGAKNHKIGLWAPAPAG